MRLKQPTLLEILVITAIVGVLTGLLLPGSDTDYSPRYPSSVVAGVNLIHLAGDYFEGNGRGRNWRLSLLADGRYSFVWSGCTGVHHREAGQAREVDGHLLLTPEKAIKQAIPRQLLPIRWDERAYLIPGHELPEFCKAIVAGREPRNELPGSYYLSNDSGRAEGLPDIPEKWLAYLRARLTIGKILEVREGGRARLALGSKQGLKVGDLLRFQGERSLGELRVTAVEEDSCQAEASYPGWNPDALKPGRNVVIDHPDIPAPDQ